MLAILMLGLSGVADGPLPSMPGRTTAERPREARPAVQTPRPRTSWSFEAPVEDVAPNGQTACAIRVLRADPSIDRGIVKLAEPRVDPAMVVPSVCAR